VGVGRRRRNPADPYGHTSITEDQKDAGSMATIANAKHLRATKQRRRTRRLALVISLLAAVGAWWVTLAPRSIGGPGTYIVVSGKSMLPLLHTGDLVIARQQSQYHLGEIVVVSIDGGEVIHRLWAGNSKAGWTTKGINKLTPDLWTIPNKDVLGTKWLVVPHAGGWLRWAGTATGRSALAAALALFVVLMPRRDRRQRVPAPSAPALRRRTLVLNSSLLLMAAAGGVLAGLAGLDASVVGLRGWARLPLTHLSVHPAFIALLAVLLLSVTLPLIGLQVGREAVSRRRAAALVISGSADQMTRLGSPHTEADPVGAVSRAATHSPASSPAISVGRGRRSRFVHRRRVRLSSLG
jgi:signal peptidase I